MSWRDFVSWVNRLLATNPPPSDSKQPSSPTYVDTAITNPLSAEQRGFNGQIVVPMYLNNVSNGLEFERTPTVWTTLDAINNLLTVIWQPANNKKFRLLGATITMSREAACASNLTISLQDGLGGSAQTFWKANVSTAAFLTSNTETVWNIDFGRNGYMAATPEHNLRLGMSSVLSAGVICVSLWGTEE